MVYSEIKKSILSVKSPIKYLGSEYGSIVKNLENVSVRFAFCFPDTYEIGMSHLGLRILYALINSREEFWCERVFAPADDFENLLREKDIKLYGLESYDSIHDFDFIGFTLQYELSYTNIINMLDLANVPIFASERTETDPIVIGGGPCACNPEPLTAFFDFFVLGDGEEVVLEILDLYNSMKKESKIDLRKRFLNAVSNIKGVYVPSEYSIINDENGKILWKFDRLFPEKRIVKDLNTSFYPKETIVPHTEIVHDRAVEEVLRGCIRGCRFCQAGFIYRPYREKTIDTINKQVQSLCDFTGYDTISLSSLSTSDYSQIEELLENLNKYTESNMIGMSLPSMRIDRFSEKLAAELMKVRKSGLTFAPEAGSQRLRDVINKNITQDDIIKACKIAFLAGSTNIKLYFMIGLPTETDEDIIAIAALAEDILNLYDVISRTTINNNNGKRKAPHISISASTFVPKPFTPFEFVPQATESDISYKQRLLRSSIHSKRKIDVSYNDFNTSLLEAVFARGDRRLSSVIYSAWKRGCKFDSWDNHFYWKKWIEAFEENGINPHEFANKEWKKDETMPWDHLDFMINKDFLFDEWEKAKNAETTPSCREKCANCGITKSIKACPAHKNAYENTDERVSD